MRSDTAQRRVKVGAPVKCLCNHDKIVVWRRIKVLKCAVADAHIRASNRLLLLQISNYAAWAEKGILQRRAHSLRWIKRIQSLKSAKAVRLGYKQSGGYPGTRAQLDDTKRLSPWCSQQCMYRRKRI